MDPLSHAAIKAWRCTLPGGAYMVRISSIVSVSQHQYLVDGAIRVYEVTIATDSSTQARFYYIEPTTGTGPGAYRSRHRTDCHISSAGAHLHHAA